MPDETRAVLPDQSTPEVPDLMKALEESLSHPTWAIHLVKRTAPFVERREVWFGTAEDRDTANVKALAWVDDPAFYVSYAHGPFVPLRDHDRLRAENETLKAQRDGLGRELTQAAQSRDLQERFYEAAMNWFDSDEWTKFEESPEFSALNEEFVASRSPQSDETDRTKEG